MNHKILLAWFALALPISSTHAFELRAAFSDRCPTTNYPTGAAYESPEIIAAIGISLASSLVDTGIAALKRAVNPGNTVLEQKFLGNGLYEAVVVPPKKEPAAVPPGAPASGLPAGMSNEPPVVRLSKKMACLVVGVGKFSEAKNGVTDWKLPFPSDRPEHSDPNSLAGPKRQVANLLGMTGPADLAFYMEAARMVSTDKSAFTWRPVRLHVGDYLNNGFFSGSSRGLAIELRMYEPATAEHFLEQVFSFDSITKPLSLGPNSLAAGQVGSWLRVPVVTDIPETISATKMGSEFHPFTYELRVVETPKPYSLAIAFADSVDTNKDSIKTKVREQLDPDAKQKATDTVQSAALASILSYGEALTKLNEDCAPEKTGNDVGKLSCSIARDKATIARNQAILDCKKGVVEACGKLPELPALP